MFYVVCNWERWLLLQVVEKDAQTESLRASIEAAKAADVSRIMMQKEIEEQEAKKKIATLENEVHLQREKVRLIRAGVQR